MGVRRWGSASVVNTTVTDDQRSPQVCGLKNGGYVVVWEDASTSQATAIRFQRFDALGAKVGNETIVPSPDGAGHQGKPTVALLSDGNFAIAHQDQDGSAAQITITRYSASGNLLGQFQGSNNGMQPHIKANEFDPGFSVAYAREQGASSSIAVLSFNANGTLINDMVLDVNGASPHLAANGGAVYVRPGFAPGTFVYTVGTNAPYEIQVAGTVINPRFAHAAGTAFAVFTEINDSGQAIAKIVFCSLSAGASEPIDLSVITGQAFAEGVTIFGHEDGTFSLLWSEAGTGGPATREIHMRQIRPGENLSIVPVGPEITLSSTGSQQHGEPSISKLADGRFVVTWVDSSGVADGSGAGIVQQILDAREGYVQGSDSLTTAETLVGHDATGDTIIGLAGNDTIYGLAGSDTLHGDDGVDTLYGGRGDDTLYGGNGADRLYGNAGDDEVYGDEGDDTVYLGRGADVADGGEGVDTLSYFAHAQGAIIDMANQTLNAGAAFDHTFQRIERINGSDVASDTLRGDGFSNYLAGFGGADTLIGNGGNDTLRGGAGADVLSGGTGADIFRYDAATDGGDTITAFSSLDDFQFVRSAFGNLAGATVDAVHFLSLASGHAATNPLQRFIFDQSTNSLWYDSNGGAAGGQSLIATIQSNAVITHQDLLLL